MHKLLTEGKTDLLTGFKSARTGRVFKAFLVKQPDGKIGFEFEPRGEGKAGAKTAAKKTTAAAKKTAAAKAPAKAPAKTAAKAAAKKTPARKKAVAEADEESTSET